MTLTTTLHARRYGACIWFSGRSGVVHEAGLYFPFVHIRDDDWLKAAALYWPSVRRLVPRGYAKHDSPTSQAFVEAKILRDEDPRFLLESTTWDLLQTLRENAERLVHRYSLEHAYADWDGQQWTDGSGPDAEVPQLGWIHATKFPDHVVDYLSEKGLAQRGRPSENEWHRHGPRENWIGLHPALASAYMTALAAQVSQRAHFQPLTDQTDLRIATPSEDVEAAMQLLLGRDEHEQRPPAALTHGVETYTMLALQHARPANLESIPAEKIVECRENLADELATFREYVAEQQTELANLATIPIEQRKLEAFAEHIEQTVELPLQRLEKGLRLHKLEPTRSLVLTGSFTPPAVVGAAEISPAAATAVGAVVAVGSAWWQVRKIREDARAASPVGYLLDVRDHLTPKTLAARIRKVLLGTYGGHT